MKTLFALLMMALSAAAYGQLLKCVSKDGKVEYANTCPQGTTETNTGIRSSSGGATAAAKPPAQKSIAERDADFKKRMIEQQEAQQKEAKKTAEAEQRREACTNAQAYLRSLEDGLRLTRTDPKTGERIYLEDAEREVEKSKAQARVSENCR